MKTLRTTLPIRRLGRSARLEVAFTPARVEPVVLDVADLGGPGPLVVSRSVLAQIRREIGGQPAESGGPLGGVRGTSLVTAFHHDPSARTNGAQYYPDVTAVNTLLRDSWNPQGINLLGFVHSHPRGYTRPSGTDASYAERIMAGIPELDRFMLPIVQTAPDTGAFSISPWVALRTGRGPRVVARELAVAADPGTGAEVPLRFDRVREAYDLGAMAATRFVAIGCGGSAGFLEDLARTGVGEFVLIDPDHVEEPNLGTQQTFVDDIGLSKALVIGRRLLRVNPDARVWVVRARVEELDDQAMARLARDWLPGSPATVPRTTVLGAFTDDFGAQARIARLGLHLGCAVVGATVYAEGLGIELTFAAPGVTPACIRCAQRSRYVAYLEQGYRNAVTSHGTPYSATTRLNALKLPVVIALIHALSPVADPAHPATARHRAFLERVADRNLVVVNLHPEAGLRLQVELLDAGQHDGSGRMVVDTTQWLRQLPDRPENGYDECPDCGGTGDLNASVGAFTDTGPMPRRYGDHRRSR